MSNGSSARWLTRTGRHAHLSIGQFLVFAGVGGVGTLCHYAVLILGVEALHAAAVTASVAGSVVGAITNFALSARLAFASKASVLDTAPRFFVVASVGFGLNWLLMWSLIKIDIQYLVAQVVSTAVILIFNYVANAMWTFGGERRGK